MYYPPQPTHWRLAALAIALTLGVAGSFALGQALGHRATPSAAARYPTVTRSAGSATGDLSTAAAPTPAPTAGPALPSAAPAQTQPLSATVPAATSHHDTPSEDGHGDGQQPKGGGGHSDGGGDGHGGGHGGGGGD